jgi:hypothetical protein
VLGQLHHAVLHDVQRRFLVADVVDERLKARFSTLCRKSESSRSVAKEIRGAAKGPRWKGWQGTLMSSWAAGNYGIAIAFTGWAVLRSAIMRCKSKGKRVRIRRCDQSAHGPGSKSDAASQGRRKGHPRFFVPEITKGSSWKSPARSSAPRPPRPAPAPSQELRGAEILVKALQAENVKYVWGYPGGAVLHIYDAFYKQDTIQHVLVRHEQAAVHAADGYARATGDVGVALVTSGPGVTNAVTGIATAYMDSIPMVIITGQVPTAAIGLDAFQECDTVGITRPIVKHNFLVKDVRKDWPR